MALLSSLTPRPSPGERIYAVGDIHGRADLFANLLERIDQDVDARARHAARLVILGDFIDRGLHSRTMLKFLRKLQGRSNRVIVLLGNLEDLLLETARGNLRSRRAWLANGGDATLSSYGMDVGELLKLPADEFVTRLVKAIGSDTFEWLASLPLTYRSGDYFFCHAGVRPGVGLEQQSREDLLWIRNRFLRSPRWHGAVVVHGHTAEEGITLRYNRINVDTGAHETGLLSSVALESVAKWAVQAKAVDSH